jgi:hypothetical protein
VYLLLKYSNKLKVSIKIIQLFTQNSRLILFILNCLKMKQTKLNTETLKWIKENPKEFSEELIKKSELVKNFSDELEPYRENNDRTGYNKLFTELFKKEEEK